MKSSNYQIEMTVVTPLSVGAGNDNEWMRGIDFVQKDGKVYVLDIQKAVALGVDVNRLTELFLKSDENGICTLLKGDLENVSSLVFSSPVKTSNSIKTFLRTQMYGKPIVAGSSIKGAIRSILFNALRTDECDNQSVFGSMKGGTDFMRFIRVGDIEMSSTCLVNTKIFNLRKDGGDWFGGWKHSMNETTTAFNPSGFNTLYECVVPGTKGYGTISMAGNLFQLLLQYGGKDSSMVYASQKKELLDAGIQGLFHVINAATRSYLLKEKAFFETYAAERSEEVNDCIDYLLGIIPDDDSSCLLKMAAGVGFHSITGDWKYPDYGQTELWEKGPNRGKKKYKSRKIADYEHHLQLMGFAKIRMMSSEEAAEVALLKDKEHQTAIAQLLAPIQAREEAERQIAEERAQRAKRQAEDRLRQEAFENLMQDAKALFVNNQLDAAISKAKEAKKLFPEKDEPSLFLVKVEREQEAKLYIEQEQAKTAERFEQPLSMVLEKVSSIGNLLGTTSKWLKMGEKTFGVNELDAFEACLKTMPQKELRNLFKKKELLIKTIGADYTQKLLERMK